MVVGRLRTVSLGKPAQQSSRGSVDGDPSRAVDGNVSTAAVTSDVEMNSYWKVDLQAQYWIGHITVIPTCCDNIDQHVSVEIRNAASHVVCSFNVQVALAYSIGFDCRPPVVGQYVSILKSGSVGGTLNLAEVQVYPGYSCVSLCQSESSDFSLIFSFCE